MRGNLTGIESNAAIARFHEVEIKNLRFMASHNCRPARLDGSSINEVEDSRTPGRCANSQAIRSDDDPYGIRDILLMQWWRTFIRGQMRVAGEDWGMNDYS